MSTARFLFISVIAWLTACENTPSVSAAPGSATEVTAAGETAPSGGPVCASDNGGITLPPGFCAVVVADRLGRARHLAVRDNGDVYVALRGRDGGVAALRDADGDGVAEAIRKFGDVGGTGIGLRAGYLYFAPDIAVVRFPLGEGLVPTGAPELVVGFPDQGLHAAKPFAFDDAGSMYVNVGAPSNACQKNDRTRGAPGLDPCPLLDGHGGVWRYRADDTGQRHDPAARYATGIRNAVALAWNRSTEKLYVVQHGRDQLSELFPRRYKDTDRAELPAEEFFEVDEGDDFGWPYCHYDHLAGSKVLGPEYGGDGVETGRCAAKEDPIVAFPGHWAPNDLLFYSGDHFPRRYRGGAFVAFHGSWNRQPFIQKGYNVVFVPFADGASAGDYEVFADGFADEHDLRSSQQARFRPMGLAEGPDGTLYISDSVKGRIWRVFFRPGSDEGV